METKTAGGRKITLIIRDEALHAQLDGLDVAGEVTHAGPTRTTNPAITHYAVVGGTVVGLSDEGYAVIRAELDKLIVVAVADRRAWLGTHVPGLDELTAALDAVDKYDDAFARAMERGDGRLPSPPDITRNAALVAWPVAADYLRLLDLAEADPSSAIGYIRRVAGERALASISTSVTVGQALASAKAEIEREINTPEYISRAAGL